MDFVEHRRMTERPNTMKTRKIVSLGQEAEVRWLYEKNSIDCYVHVDNWGDTWRFKLTDLGNSAWNVSCRVNYYNQKHIQNRVSGTPEEAVYKVGKDVLKHYPCVP